MNIMFCLSHCLVALISLSHIPTCTLGKRLPGSSNQAADELVLSSGSGGLGESCTSLTNKGSHFSVKVAVGTPPQRFELVADTGSSSVIVASCVCKQQGYCPPNDPCFRGTNMSSSFALAKPDGVKSQSPGGAVAVSMTFGSGTVTSIVATDVVQVAGVKAVMRDGLLLMVDRRQLKIQGEFQGILGLGPLDRKLNDSSAGDLPKAGDGYSVRPSAPAQSGPHFSTRLFLEQAHVDRFSICFNDASEPGALRVNIPPFQNPLPAIGSFHWGLGLFGVSVGSHTAGAVFCGASEMKGNQKTPCGAIPDSGTTLMMGPAQQVTALFGSLCDNWGRCRAARQGKLRNMSASHAFQTLIHQCGEWMTNGTDINEVPSVFLTMGAPGKLQKVELTPWAYIVETVQEVYERQIKHLMGVIPVIVDVPTGKTAKVCMPSFGVQEYNTQDNGPVWILGTPLFYQYTVGYGLKGPSIAFLKQKCGACNETIPSLLSSKNLLHRGGPARARPMRALLSAARVPYMDKSLPL